MKRLITLLFFAFTITLFKTHQTNFKFVWLTKADWKELENISYVGKNQVTVVHTTTRLSIINETQYKDKSEPFTKTQIAKLEEIIAKYD